MATTDLESKEMKDMLSFARYISSMKPGEPMNEMYKFGRRRVVHDFKTPKSIENEI